MKLILEIPLHLRQVRHAGHVTDGVVGVGLFDLAYASEGETVVCWLRMSTGLMRMMRFFVGVEARPVPIRCHVQQTKNVAYGVVIILFAVPVQGLAVGGK